MRGIGRRDVVCSVAGEADDRESRALLHSGAATFVASFRIIQAASFRSCFACGTEHRSHGELAYNHQAGFSSPNDDVSREIPHPSATCVPIYITSIGAANGFTDPSKDNTDTVNDLREQLDGRDGIIVVPTREEAVIVLVVLQRETAGLHMAFGGAARDRAVHVKFLFNGTESDMSAAAASGTIGSGGAWGRAAKKIAKQVEEWVKTNRAKLAAVAQVAR